MTYNQCARLAFLYGRVMTKVTSWHDSKNVDRQPAPLRVRYTKISKLHIQTASVDWPPEKEQLDGFCPCRKILPDNPGVPACAYANPWSGLSAKH